MATTDRNSRSLKLRHCLGSNKTPVGQLPYYLFIHVSDKILGHPPDWRLFLQPRYASTFIMMLWKTCFKYHTWLPSLSLCSLFRWQRVKTGTLQRLSPNTYSFRLYSLINISFPVIRWLLRMPSFRNLSFKITHSSCPRILMYVNVLVSILIL